MSKECFSSWGFYKGNNTDFLKPLLENHVVFYSVKLYSTSFISSSTQFSIEDGKTMILHGNILRAKKEMLLVLGEHQEWTIWIMRYLGGWNTELADGQDRQWQNKLKRALPAEEELWPKIQSHESGQYVKTHWGWQAAGAGSKCKCPTALASQRTKRERATDEARHRCKGQIPEGLIHHAKQIRFYSVSDEQLLKGFKPQKAWSGVHFS